MRKALAIICSFYALLATAQESSKWYRTSGGEWMFSSAILDVNGSDQGSIIRFSPFFNATGLTNHDFSSKAGMFIGLSVKNVGFIYDVPDTSLRYKFRIYDVGIPIGLKFGDMDGTFLFAGYEIEFPINYKEKLFENEKKEDKFNVWFSDRTDPVYHTLMLGMQFKNGATLKFKYHITNFHDQGFTEEVDGVEVKPYDGLNANVFYISLGYGLFKKKDFWKGMGKGSGGSTGRPQNTDI